MVGRKREMESKKKILFYRKDFGKLFQIGHDGKAFKIRGIIYTPGIVKGQILL